MKIVERKEVTRVEINDVIIGRKCDVCGNNIEKIERGGYNYFKITTHHHDWGNDSIDSYEYFDACCPNCVIKFTQKYIENAYKTINNSKEIEIEHIRTLEEGAHDRY